jgi:predicted acetyltransferase
VFNSLTFFKTIKETQGMQSKIIEEIRIGNDTNYARAVIIDLGIPNAARIISLSATGEITMQQRFELGKKIENFCNENKNKYSLMTKDAIGTGFHSVIGQTWNKDETLNFYLFKIPNFIAAHQKIPEKLENLNSETFLDYIADIRQVPKIDASKAAQSLIARCQRFSSIVYAQMLDGQIISAAEVHENQPNTYSIDMLGTIQSAKNQGYATQLYSYLIHQLLEQNIEHIGNTGSENHAMQRIFQKIGGVLQDSQTTWSWSN